MESADMAEKVYGPYLRPDGRKHVVIVCGGQKRTVSYPKYLVEKELGRSLHTFEVVHHRDGNFRNNDLSNLEVVDSQEHGERHTRGQTTVQIKCILCGKIVIKKLADYKHNRAQGKKGPYCGKSCAGKASHL